MANELETLLAIERSGDLNPAQRTRLDQLRSSGSTGSYSGILYGNDGEGIPSPYGFDYAAEAQKAYGELGPYYDRLLRESQGDMNKVLSRLVEDYDRGKRIRREDYEAAKAAQEQGVRDNAQARGLYSRSNFDPGGGFGIADALLSKVRQPLDQSYQRADESATLARDRTQSDTLEEQKRREFQMEQQRRTQAGQLANERGAQSYQKWNATQLI